MSAAALLAACRPGADNAPKGAAPTSGKEGEDPGEVAVTTDELGDSLNDYQDIISYNNYYEFTTDKEGVAGLAADFRTSPWEVEVGGLVKNPGCL